MIKRYPESKNKSLRAWSSADEYLANYLAENELKNNYISVYNDTFGYLSVNLFSEKLQVICNLKSQEKAIYQNLQNNNLAIQKLHFTNPLEKLNTKTEVGVLKIPKSLDLFELYLNHFTKNAIENATLICGFMTRNFTKQIIGIASDYFEEVEQSLAWKKSRLLVLSKIKKTEKKDLINTISYKKDTFLQYFGVFSAKNIDYASQFLLNNLQIPEEINIVLDLASGNGVLAKKVQEIIPNSSLHLVDDSFLAIESSKLNLKGKNIHFHHQNNLENLEKNTFDYVISNPPFHLEHEIDLSLPLGLFQEVERILKPNGKFQLVANRHLNYKTHLEKIFSMVKIDAENEKFIVYSCY